MSEKSEKAEWDAFRASELEGLSCVEEVRNSSDGPSYLVGGAVRDLLQGKEPGDLDFAVDGPLEPVIAAVEGEVTRFPQFCTASVTRPDGVAVDIARTRKESYESPGSLPRVEPARIEEDLLRRDFTINAMAVSLDSPEVLIDPLGGQLDLAGGVLRALHPESLRDDPTRSFRAARYSARLGLEPDRDLVDQIAAVDLSTISSDRIENEIGLCAIEECESGALTRAAEWGLVSIPRSEPRLLQAICGVFGSESWSGYLRAVGVDAADVLVRVISANGAGGDEEPEALRSARAIMVERPSDAGAIGAIASGEDPGVLVISRALGAEWLDAWPERLAAVRLTIGGAELLAAGVPAGPLIGIGLASALEKKMNGEAEGATEEIQRALAGCRDAGWEPDRE